MNPRKVEISLGQLDVMRFNVMAVGCEGLGKTTFLQSFLRQYRDVQQSPIRSNAEFPFLHTATVHESDSIILRSNKASIEIHLTDTPGFGMSTCNIGSIELIKKHVLSKHEKWIQLKHQELTIQELNKCDERIHCLFYFLPPHRMSSLGCACLAQLMSLAPLVPVVAKADCMTPGERKKYLEEVRSVIGRLNTAGPTRRGVYNFQSPAINALHLEQVDDRLSASWEYYQMLPQEYPWMLWLSESKLALHRLLSDETEGASSTASVTTHDRDDVSLVPNVFAVVCTTSPRGLREYPFGTVDCYNPLYSDLRRLQELVLESGVHLMAMIRTTERMTIQLHKERMNDRMKVLLRTVLMVLVLSLTAQCLLANGVSVSSLIRLCTLDTVDLM